jgi:hypothetical protein
MRPAAENDDHRAREDVRAIERTQVGEEQCKTPRDSTRGQALMASEPYYTKIPEWASERGASGMALAAYQHLAKRLNRERGDRIVDPSRARLAADLGLKKADDVDPYLRELAVLGMAKPIAEKGKRTKFFLPEWPPEGYDGPMSMVEADRWQRKDSAGYEAWRAAQRALVEEAEAPYKAKSRARVARSAAKRRPAGQADVPVATGRSEREDVPVTTGTYLPVVTGMDLPVATGPNQTMTNEGTSGGGGRRPPPVVGGPADGGFAAPAEQRDHVAEPMPWREIGQVLSAIPAPLVTLLEQQFPVGLPPEASKAIARLLAEPRTVAEAQERISRRWLRYENDALSLSGRGIDSPIAVLYELLAPSYCEGNNVRCEDGFDLDRQDDCRLCVEEKAAYRAGQEPTTEAPTAPVPEPRPLPKVMPMQNCDKCEKGYRGPAGLCGVCREDVQYA